ncbi:MAG TPA: tRNA (5-methylaminomethyl-2-thiouridylate)-methyltransferase, partial [Desulfobulbaceae bacterium]|nr:tRNA (5-methylaminomethyl-2-thiouridylate)-methyltransferase [Desulfobulbaceae bacterium]
MMDRRIGIAMSGGVDSTACALLLRERYDIQGFF